MERTDDMLFRHKIKETLEEELTLEGITVTEDLIKRTLEAVHTDEKQRINTTEPQEREKAKKGSKIVRLRNLGYACGTVAAACLLLVVGLKSFGGMKENKEMASEMAAPNTANVRFSPEDTDTMDVMDAGTESGENESKVADDVVGFRSEENEAVPEDEKAICLAPTTGQNLPKGNVILPLPLVTEGAGYIDQAFGFITDELRELEAGYETVDYLFSLYPCEGVVTDLMEVAPLGELLERLQPVGDDTTESSKTDYDSNGNSEELKADEDDTVACRILFLDEEGTLGYYLLTTNGKVQRAFLQENRKFSPLEDCESSEGNDVNIIMEWLREHNYE